MIHPNYADAIKILDEKYAVVTYMQGFKMVKIEWRDAVEFEEYKHTFETVLNHALNGNEILRFCSDIRNQGVVGPENRKWFENELLPRAVKAGLKRATVITDANIFKRYYINLIISKVNKFNMPFKICANDTEAIAFLEKEE